MAKKANSTVGTKLDRRTNHKDDPEAVAARERVMTMIDAIPPKSLVESIKRAPSLRGMILGYIAELMFERHIPEHYPVILSEHIKSHDDHKRDENKSDRTITYNERRYGIQLKSVQTNSIGRSVATDLLQADVQNDASDRRTVKLGDGSRLETTCYVRGEYAILAVPLFPFTGTWEFAYKRNRDCRPCQPTKRNKYTKFQAERLLSTTEKITWPLSEAWETNLLQLLDDTIGSPVGQPDIIAEPGGKIRVVETTAVILPLEDEEV